MLRKSFDTVAVFLNRACPRNCQQCGISDNSKKPLSIDKWKEAFKLLHEELDTNFFLVLGTEPLLMRDDLVELVKWYKENNLFYGFYSTSPQPLFNRYKFKLLDVGLNNWSCGIDHIPGMFPTDTITEKKTREGLSGLKWMAERGVQTFSVTTVSSLNLPYVPQILEYLQENVPNVISCFNPIEYAHDVSFDFFSKREEMEELIVPSDRHEEVIKMCEGVLELTRRRGYQVQNTDKYILDYLKHHNKLDFVCKGTVGIGLDCDGSFRLCGYNRGSDNGVKRFSVWDLKDKDKKEEILDSWQTDANNCKGCYWSYIHALDETFETLIPRSSYFNERWRNEIPDVKQYLKNRKL